MKPLWRIAPKNRYPVARRIAISTWRWGVLVFAPGIAAFAIRPEKVDVGNRATYRRRWKSKRYDGAGKGGIPNGPNQTATQTHLNREDLEFRAVAQEISPAAELNRDSPHGSGRADFHPCSRPVESTSITNADTYFHRRYYTLGPT